MPDFGSMVVADGVSKPPMSDFHRCNHASICNVNADLVISRSAVQTRLSAPVFSSTYNKSLLFLSKCRQSDSNQFGSPEQWSVSFASPSDGGICLQERRAFRAVQNIPSR